MRSAGKCLGRIRHTQLGATSIDSGCAWRHRPIGHSSTSSSAGPRAASSDYRACADGAPAGSRPLAERAPAALARRGGGVSRIPQRRGGGGAPGAIRRLVPCGPPSARRALGRSTPPSSRGLPTQPLLALPGALTAYFAFNAGGFFPETPALVAIVLILVLVVRITTARGSVRGLQLAAGVAAAALGLYCLWTLLSATWSDAPARALIEFDRALVYLLALVLFGSMPRTADARFAGCCAASRWRSSPWRWPGSSPARCPTSFPTDPRLYEGRLGCPLTYWNALGILGALGAVLCMHLTASLREPLGRARARCGRPYPFWRPRCC